MACRNICERIYSKIVVGQSHILLVRNIVEDVNIILSLKDILSMLWNAAQDYSGRKRMQRRSA
jgi:hypothetical protein